MSQCVHPLIDIILCSLSFVDASEMVATYGARLGEIRGFVVGGWEACGNTEGEVYIASQLAENLISAVITGDMSGRGKLFRVSLAQFECDLLPSLTSHDCVICIQGSSPDPRLSDTMDRYMYDSLTIQAVLEMTQWPALSRILSGPAKCGLLMVTEDTQPIQPIQSIQSIQPIQSLQSIQPIQSIQSLLDSRYGPELQYVQCYNNISAYICL